MSKFMYSCIKLSNFSRYYILGVSPIVLFITVNPETVDHEGRDASTSLIYLSE